MILAVNVVDTYSVYPDFVGGFVVLFLVVFVLVVKSVPPVTIILKVYEEDSGIALLSVIVIVTGYLPFNVLDFGDIV